MREKSERRDDRGEKKSENTFNFLLLLATSESYER